MEYHGGPENWQFLAFAENCGGSGQSTVDHEMFHAFGFGHEHSRPDRDQYLNVNENAASKPSSSGFYILSFTDELLVRILLYCGYKPNVT